MRGDPSPRQGTACRAPTEARIRAWVQVSLTTHLVVHPASSWRSHRADDTMANHGGIMSAVPPRLMRICRMNHLGGSVPDDCRAYVMFSLAKGLLGRLNTWHSCLAPSPRHVRRVARCGQLLPLATAVVQASHGNVGARCGQPVILVSAGERRGRRSAAPVIVRER